MRTLLYLLAALVIVPAASASTSPDQPLPVSVEMVTAPTDAPTSVGSCDASATVSVVAADLSESAQVAEPDCYKFFIRINDEGEPVEGHFEKIPCPEDD